MSDRVLAAMADMDDDDDEEETMLEIVTRDRWGARLPSIKKYLEKPATNVFYVLTYSSVCTKMRRCIKALKYHQNIRMNIFRETDIDYNFMLGYDGLVYEGRGWGVQPSLPKKYRRKAPRSISIAYIAPADDERSPEMQYAKFDLVYYGMAQGHIDPDYMIYDIREDRDGPYIYATDPGY